LVFEPNHSCVIEWGLLRNCEIQHDPFEEERMKKLLAIGVITCRLGIVVFARRAHRKAHIHGRDIFRCN